MQKLYHHILSFCNRYTRRIEVTIGVCLLLYALILPRTLFRNPTCMVLNDAENNLLGARVAADGQWRFPTAGSTNQRFAACLVAFEDKRFYYHLGIDPIGIGRAMLYNIRRARVVSGGSTISMQVIRMSRCNPRRTVLEKIYEIILATRLEYSYNKTEILNFYASNAPFGGNVVGLEAAAWRYFGKSSQQLSWGEAAMLAVLPNSPSLVHLGKNRVFLLRKRNKLLLKLLHNHTIDQITYDLACSEPIPEKPHDLPQLAPHLLDRAYKTYFEGSSNIDNNTKTELRTTISRSLQNLAQDIANRYHNELKTNEVNNLSCMIMDTETGDILAYIGNVGDWKDVEHGAQVDVIDAPRSSGSIMKPYLYALMNDEGLLLPTALVPDIPTTILGYRPENYSSSYDGVVRANTALARSLNIPAVRELNDYGVTKFHQKLRQFGLTTITKPPDYYGLPLILGGAEVKLFDLMSVYSSMGRVLNHFAAYDSQYEVADWRKANYDYKNTINSKPNTARKTKQITNLSAGAIFTAFDAMQKVERPTSEGGWTEYEGTKQIAWKTGTSWGGRDAWAIGITPRYTVGVWIGNADGEGRPGLIGVTTAAPVLFDLFNLLPNSSWWSMPADDMRQVAVCHQSGWRAGADCAQTDTIWAAKRGNEAKSCPFHQRIHTDKTGKYQVNLSCAAASEMQTAAWFILPPLEEQYYKVKHPDYLLPPPMRADCGGGGQLVATNAPMQWVYPRHPTKIMTPIDLSGQEKDIVFQIAHRRTATKIFWYIDNNFFGTTTDFHQRAVHLATGKHTVVLVDADGNRLEQAVEVLGREH